MLLERTITRRMDAILIKASFLAMWGLWGIVILMHIIARKSWLELLVMAAVLLIATACLLPFPCTKKAERPKEIQQQKSEQQQSSP
jgi:hypothetical protein